MVLGLNSIRSILFSLGNSNKHQNPTGPVENLCKQLDGELPTNTSLTLCFSFGSRFVLDPQFSEPQCSDLNEPGQITE